MWKVSDALLDASTSEDVEEIIQHLGQKIKWVPLGNNEGNFSTIAMTNDAYNAITERCTNAMDAMIEFQVETHPELKKLHSPRKVIEDVYKIPYGNLRNASSQEVGKLAKEITLSFKESENQNAPTIQIQDNGIGQHPDDFPNTLLGLSRNYKVSKFYLIGAFGQGGQTSFFFCHYGIVISRKAQQLLKEGQKDEIGWSIVRYRDPSTSEVVYKQGLYEYCVEATTGQPLRFDPAEFRTLFSHGTIIKLVHYKMTKGGSNVLQPAGTAWGYLSQTLFDPILPFRLSEERKRYEVDHRNFAGLAPRLWHGGKKDKVEIENETYEHHELENHGKITINFWILKQIEDSAPSPGQQQTRWHDIKKGFVSGSDAIFITLNGQQHDVWQTNFLKDDCNLTYSFDNIIVQVDCDELSDLAKRELIATTRELRRGDIRDLLMEEVSNVLKNDRNILAFEKKTKEGVLFAKTQKDTSKIRSLVGKFILKNPNLSQFIAKKGAETGQGPAQVKKKQPPGPDEEEGDEPIREGELEAPTLLEVPTILHIANKRDPIRVEKGGNCLIRLEINAVDAYLEAEPQKLRFENETNIARHKSRSKLRKGKLSVYIHCPRTARVGQRDRVTFQLELPNKAFLTDSRDVAVIEPIVRIKKPKEVNLPEPRITAVRKDDEMWNKLQYDEKSVGQIYIDENNEENSMIVVSLEKDHLKTALAGKSLEAPIAAGVEDRYGAGMAYYLLLDEVERRKNLGKSSEQKKSGTKVDQDTTEKHNGYSRTLDMVAETVAFLSMPPD